MDPAEFHVTLYQLAFLRADTTTMADQQQWLAGKPDYENWGLSLASDIEAYAGHIGKAMELNKKAVDSAERTDDKESGRLLANAAF